MKIKTIKTIKNKEEARQEAIKLQYWQSKKGLSYGEILKYQEYLKTLAEKFDLKEEFNENGLI